MCLPLAEHTPEKGDRMETKKHLARKALPSFEVTRRVAVATIEIGHGGDLTPHEAAFLAVAKADEPGVYEWQWPDASECMRVTVHADSDTIYAPPAERRTET
jgi:hypothetical protein